MEPSNHAPTDLAQKLATTHPDDLVALYTFDEACYWASSSHETILGYSPAEMVGKKWTEVVAPEDHAHASLAGDDALLNGQSIEFSLRGLTKSGDRVPLRGNARILADPATRTGYLLFRGTVIHG